MDNNKKYIENIRFLSDFHFCNKESEDKLIKYITENFHSDIIILAGDFYDDFENTINFVKQLEFYEITGFFVLGNHDYWNKGHYTYQEVIEKVMFKTKNHLYFKFLKTGIKYEISDLVFIGDTGWTSLNDGKKCNDFSQDMFILPEHHEIKNFSFEQIQYFHKKWVNFANKIINENEKVIMVTHYPMFNKKEYVKIKEKKDLWWESYVEISNEKNNFWNIYGHTHKNKKIKNFVTRQLLNKKISYNSFGSLHKLSSVTDLTLSKQAVFKKFYSSDIVYTNDKYEIKYIQERGYKRAAANINVIHQVANNLEKYISKIEKSYNQEKYENIIGYTYKKANTPKIRDVIESSIEILKHGMQDIRSFMTAVVVTGYVWNNMIDEIQYMRPLDDVDIIRLFLCLKTIKKHNLLLNNIKKIERHKFNKLIVNEISVFIPVINDLYQLNQNDLISLKQIEMNSLIRHDIKQLSIDIVWDKREKKKSNLETKNNSDYDEYKEYCSCLKEEEFKTNNWIVINNHTVGVVLDKGPPQHNGIRIPMIYFNIISQNWIDVNLEQYNFLKMHIFNSIYTVKIIKLYEYVYFVWNKTFSKLINLKFPNHFAYDKKNRIIFIIKSKDTLDNKTIEAEIHEIFL